MKTTLPLSRHTLRRLFVYSGPTSLALAVLALAGCTSGPTPRAASGPAATGTNAIAPASGPGTGSGYSNYGRPLSTTAFLRLTTGNTLFRPLADGGRTRVFISPAGDLMMRVSNPARHTVTETGRQSTSSKEICWTLKGRPAPLCFHPYWNGRLLTLQFTGNKVLPAQFLVEHGRNLPLLKS